MSDSITFCNKCGHEKRPNTHVCSSSKIGNNKAIEKIEEIEHMLRNLDQSTIHIALMLIDIVELKSLLTKE